MQALAVSGVKKTLLAGLAMWRCALLLPPMPVRRNNGTVDGAKAWHSQPEADAMTTSVCVQISFILLTRLCL
jgi:hypothetical protein